jgi:hypothetical protein
MGRDLRADLSHRADLDLPRFVSCKTLAEPMLREISLSAKSKKSQSIRLRFASRLVRFEGKIKRTTFAAPISS